MKPVRIIVVTAVLSSMLTHCRPPAETVPPSQRYVLQYRSPAASWTEALPVGNGKLGAMVYGGVAVSYTHLRAHET